MILLTFHLSKIVKHKTKFSNKFLGFTLKQKGLLSYKYKNATIRLYQSFIWQRRKLG
jgi:hypothetical protein